MRFKYSRFHIGLRTLKTTAAVIISMMIVSAYGATDSKLIFAMLGAMAAMEHSFKESLESCLTQIVGMFFGLVVGGILLALPFPELLDAGIGIILVITMYNVLHIRYSPSLPCLIVATYCTTPDILPLTYTVGRMWDTAIGMAVGMAINTLIFPYDNSKRLQSTAQCLENEILRFLEDMFDGDDHLPGTENMVGMVDDMARQLVIFSKQSTLLYRKQNREKLEAFQIFVGKFRQLLAQMEVLCRMDYPGRLDEENRRRLRECGAQIKDERALEEVEELDIVTNYHVAQILTLREELMKALEK